MRAPQEHRRAPIVLRLGSFALGVRLVVARFDAEEELLAPQFGSDHGTYHRRSWRLISRL